MDVEELPEDYNQRFNVLKQRFSQIKDDVILHKICSTSCIMYLASIPTFTLSYIENNQVWQKSVAVGTIPMYSVVGTKTNKIFILYQISDAFLRGNWIDDVYDVKRKRRESKIDMIIDQSFCVNDKYISCANSSTDVGT